MNLPARMCVLEQMVICPSGGLTRSVTVLYDLPEAFFCYYLFPSTRMFRGDLMLNVASSRSNLRKQQSILRTRPDRFSPKRIPRPYL